MRSYDWRAYEEVIVDKFGTRKLKTIVESYKLSEGSYGSVIPVSQRILPANASVNEVTTDKHSRITSVTYYKDGKRYVIE